MRLDSERAGRRSPISLTPLIDVVFILLPFFMLTSRFQQYQAIALDVPSDGAHAATPSDVEPLLLELRSDGRVTIDGGPLVDIVDLVDSEAMGAALADEAPVHVRTDADVTLAALTRLMDRLAASGLSSVSLRGLR